MNDQSIKADAGKIRPTLVPRQIIRDIAEVRQYGNMKYPEGGEDNWKNVEIQRYRDAMCRHLLAYLDDPKSIDEESGLLHRKHIACNWAFICELEEEENEQTAKEDLHTMRLSPIRRALYGFRLCKR